MAFLRKFKALLELLKVYWIWALLMTMQNKLKMVKRYGTLLSIVIVKVGSK